MDEEGLLDTPNKQIHIGRPIDFDEELFKKQLDELYEEANGDEIDIKAAGAEDCTYVYPEGRLVLHPAGNHSIGTACFCRLSRWRQRIINF